MLAVTNHISANLVAAPFLWVIPMAAYLLTFMIAFARRGRVTLSKVSQVVSLLLLLTPYITVGAPVQAGLMIWIVLVAHIAILFSGALLCHTALAGSRPHPRHLTEFYFWIALGGVLSGNLRRCRGSVDVPHRIRIPTPGCGRCFSSGRVRIRARG